ncbi:MAG: hypothetical protein LQ338_000135 [Usnochroma carphineum]|nr:MAG: hypothetical protein LQ338_000135 [Usnochroma carphineum]
MSSEIPIRFLDGGLGTTLESPPHNAKFPAETRLWSSHFLITSPDTLTRVHRAFVDAGADVLLTATYQSSLEGFTATERSSGSGNPNEREDATYNPQEAAALMRSAVSLARQAFSSAGGARNENARGDVALSLGAYGATMQPSTEYSGDYEPESMRTAEGLYDWHAERLRVFKDDQSTWNSIDYVSFETLPVLQEIYAVKRVMATHNRDNKNNDDGKDKKWWISCVFPNDDLTMPDGTDAKKAVSAMLSLEVEGKADRPWGIGINCTDIKKLDKLIRQYEAATEQVLSPGSPKESWPWLVIYPDGAQGSVYNTETGEWEMNPDLKAQGPQVPWHEELAEIVTNAAERGLWKGILVGGCCKTMPEDIRKLRSQLTSVKSDAVSLETR